MTAIEYLEEQIKASNENTYNDVFESIEVAKRLEINQIEKAIDLSLRTDYNSDFCPKHNRKDIINIILNKENTNT